MAKAFDQIESPIDYRLLWGALKTRLREMGTDHAMRCATELDANKIRQHQGAFRFAQEVIGEMDSLLDDARGPVPEDANPS